MIDTHTHSYHSPDGFSSMKVMVQAALQCGLAGIACTEHGEWNPGDEAFGFLDLDAYIKSLQEVRAQFGSQLRILSGIELGNPHDFPEQVQQVLDAYPFDIVLGSVHWLDDMPGWEPPGAASDLHAWYVRYFQELLTLVAHADFDILGHLDLVRRDSWQLCQQILPLEDYAEIIQPALRCLVERGKGLEINTSGLRKGMPEPNPNLTVLRWYHQLGGEVLTFGSDAHRPEHVAYGFVAARELALAAGFRRIPRFQQRRIVDWIAL